MENENITNRGVTVEVGPTLASVGGQGGENDAPQAEGLVTTTGGDAVDTQMKETLQSTEGGIMISSMNVQEFFEEFRDLISISDDANSNIQPFILSMSVVKVREWLRQFI